MTHQPTSTSTIGGEEAERALEIGRLHRLYDETGNPLYVWEVIYKCMHCEPAHPIPDWCLIYLKDTAKNIFLLSRGADFAIEKPIGGRLTDDQAFKLTAEALSFTRKGSRNVFRRLSCDLEDIRDALASERGGAEALRVRQQGRNVTRGQGNRIAARGRRLLGLKSRGKPAD